MAAKNNEAALAQLMRNFGAKLEKDVLLSVLEVTGGDVKQAISFLRAGKDDYVDPGPSTEVRLPKGYMTPPPTHSFAKLEKLQRAKTPAQEVKEFLLRDGTTLYDHVVRYRTQAGLYVGALLVLLKHRVELSAGARWRVLAVAWMHRRYALATHMLTHKEQFNLPEVLRALRALDLPRRVREVNRRIERLKKQGCARPATLAQLRSRLLEFQNEMFEDQKTSVSGALCRRVHRWIRSIDASALQFYALQLPREPWRNLADIVHPSPACFQLPWFLDYVFGQAPPADSMMSACAELGPANVDELTKRYDVPYSFLRKRVPQISAAIAARVARAEKLDALIWFYEELTANGGAKLAVDKAIQRRLEAGEQPEFGYGKLMERLLYFKRVDAPFFATLVPVAEKRLRSIALPLEQPAMLLGDASFSMDVAIRTSTIIASLLAVLARAELRFFNVKVVKPSVVPRNASQVLEVATKTKADGLTAPAVALKDLYDQRRVIKFFVVVTDEVENEPHKGEFFAQLFYRYHTEVFPARIVFVSFLENPSIKGRMVTALESFGIVPLQFRLDAKRPDLTKVDSLLGILAAETEHFSTVVHTLSQLMDDGAHVGDVLKKLNSPSMAMPATAQEAELMAQEKSSTDAPAAAAVGEIPSAAETSKAAASLEAREKSDDKASPFECPITMRIMRDPCIAADGITYEREAIEAWLAAGKSTSPFTGKELPHKHLVPNVALRSMILEKAEAKK